MMAENHGVEEVGGEINVSDWSPLQDCISNIISFTTPEDACVFATVSKTFESAVKSDIVWEKFLPPEYPSLIPPSLASSSKMEIYFSLCNHPVLIEDGKKSFWLEKKSGKRCIMLCAESLNIQWGSFSEFWAWIPSPDSRFERVASLRDVLRFAICGTINARDLSPMTRYSSYLVFKCDYLYGFRDLPIQAVVGVVGKKASNSLFCFDPGEDVEFVKKGRRKWYFEKQDKREDGWMEIELGSFFNKGGLMNNDRMEMNAFSTNSDHWKCGLIIEGIELRPWIT